jgi:hypothetical protein
MLTPRTSSSKSFLLISATLIAATLAITLWAITPRTARRPGSHHGPCHKCGQQVRGLAVGFEIWAEQHEGQLPAPDADWVSLFIAEGYAPLEMFSSPEDPVRDHISYIYVPAQTIDPTGERVLLYEYSDLHPDCGVHIAYHDGHVELHQPEEAERIITTLRN